MFAEIIIYVYLLDTKPSCEKKGDDLASHFVLAFQWSVSLKPCQNNFVRVLYFLNLQLGTTTLSCENKITDYNLAV